MLSKQTKPRIQKPFVLASVIYFRRKDVGLDCLAVGWGPRLGPSDNSLIFSADELLLHYPLLYVRIAREVNHAHGPTDLKEKDLSKLITAPC